MTIVQKQCLLCYLGYYQDEIDGKFGPASVAATRQFQQDHGLTEDGRFGPETEETILLALTGRAESAGTPDAFWEGIPNFRKEEFRCKCGGKFCDGFPAQPSQTLVRLAQRVRDHFGAPVNISSGVRCAQHNQAVGGVENSRHKRGLAMDFTVKGFTAAQVLPFVKAQEETHYTYAIDGFYIHMDV